MTGRGAPLEEQPVLGAGREQARAQAIAATDAGAVIRTVAHELRTPLHGIIASADLLLDPAFGPPSEERTRQLAARIKASAEQMTTLIDDLLDLAQSQAGRLALKLAPVQLADVLADVETEIGLFAADKGVALDTSTAAAVTVLADRRRVRQVLHNLLHNAVKFTPRGGRVRVGIEPIPPGARVVVEDTGIGVRAEDLDRIFEPFEQAEPTAGGGSGLGLAIARSLAELHGGRLEATSEVGVGSTFVLTLPMRDSDEDHG